MIKSTNQINYPFCQWELIAACNMRCIGCRVPQENSEQPKIEIVLRTVNYLATAGVTNLEIIGGEVFLYNDISALMRYLNEQKEIKRFSIITNAIMTEKLQEIKPELSHEKGGLVVSINYTEEQCRRLIKTNTDTAMAKKSLAGWQALKEFSKHCPVRVNCVINTLNISNLADIAWQVINAGGSFSFCPLVYQKQGCESGIEFAFRSSNVGFAPTEAHRKIMEKSMTELMALKGKHPGKIIPTIEYMQIVIESCKNPNRPYPANCKNKGIPYLRISSKMGKSRRDGKTSFRLKACSDVEGSEISQIVASDLRDANVRKKLPLIYQSDRQVIDCCNKEGCPWSVTHILSQKNI